MYGFSAGLLKLQFLRFIGFYKNFCQITPISSWKHYITLKKLTIKLRLGTIRRKNYGSIRYFSLLKLYYWLVLKVSKYIIYASLFKLVFSKFFLVFSKCRVMNKKNIFSKIKIDYFLIKYIRKTTSTSLIKNYLSYKAMGLVFLFFKQRYFLLRNVASLALRNIIIEPIFYNTRKKKKLFFFKIHDTTYLNRLHNLNHPFKGQIPIFTSLSLRGFIKKTNVLVKLMNFRWILTNINLIFNFSHMLQNQSFMFFSSKYLRRLYLFKAYYSEFWLLYNMFQVENNKRWYIFFKSIKPRYLMTKFTTSVLNKIAKLNSIQFKWIDRSKKKKLLAYYYSVKHTDLRSFFYFYLRFFLQKTFHTDINYVVKRVKFKGYLIEYFYSLYKKYYMFQKQFKIPFYLLEFIELAFMSMRIKNISLLHNWITNKMCYIFYKNHWKFIYFLNIFFTSYFSYFKTNYGIKGIQYYFKGKINAKGSVRKKSLKFIQGCNSYTNLNLKANFKKGIVRTDTGVIAFFCMLTY